MSKKLFGVCPKGQVDAYTIKNSGGMEATILNLGGTVQKLLVPVDGKLVDVCLGYDTVEDYIGHKAYFGALVGRNSNRIAGAEFTLNGKTIKLTDNNGGKQLHGGVEGFTWKLWDAKEEGQSLVLTYFSADGEEGFPGNVQVKVTYTVEEDNALRIDYEATTDQDTVINMTNHSYFNLNGGGSVLDHTLQIDADCYTPTDGIGIPTGEIAPVAGSCFDFRQEKELGQDIEDPALSRARGYDANYCLKGDGLRKIAVLKGEKLTMETETTTPGVQLYCSNFSKPHPAKNSSFYEGYCFVCLETQGWPDSVHHENFPSDIIRAGETYRQTTIYRFK